MLLMKFLSAALIAFASLSILCGPSIVRGREDQARRAALPETGRLFFNARFKRIQRHGNQAVLTPARKYGWSDKYHWRDTKTHFDPIFIKAGSQFEPNSRHGTIHYVVQGIEADGVYISANKTPPFTLKWK
jgi:hypothetical protein